MAGISIVHDLPLDEWCRFVAEHPDGNIFHTPEMFQVFARAKDFHPGLWAATRDARVLALLLPVQITVISGIFSRWTTRSVAYGSVLYAPGEEGQQALALLLRSYTQDAPRGSLFTELRNLSSLENVQPILSQYGFLYQEHLNFLIDLQRPVEMIFDSIGQRTRKNIRRGLNRGKVIVKEVTERKHLAACYDLLRRTYHTAHVPLAEYSLFEAAFDVLYPKRMIRYTLAYVEQTPVAASVELLYKDVVYGWYGGVDRTYSSFMPNELLMWHILEWGADNGYRVYDFGGAGKPGEPYGVREFKSKFGGQLVCYGRNVWVPHPALLSLCELGYGLYRRLL